VENVGDYLEAFDMFLFPSRHEGLGSILLDAMDFALPVIATDVGGIPEVIENAVNGFIVQPNAIEDMIENILRLYSNDDLLQSISKKNKEESQAYSVALMSKRYVQIYDENMNHD
jgi:glycosyltransferase involved in cell wall biosynthesis